MGHNSEAAPLFGDLLKRMRQAAGLTLAELAARANLSVRGLSDLERGVRHSPRHETVQLLLDALALSPDERIAFQEAARAGRAHPERQSAVSDTGSEPPPLQVFLIADMRGYTRFTAAHGDEAAAHLAMRFAALAQVVAKERGGQVLELRGDEIMAAFPSVRRALHAAVELQKRWQAEGRANPAAYVPIGTGLDAGEAVPVEGGFRGSALNLTGRLCSLAGPEEVIASETVIHLAGKVEDLIYSERGTVQLKGFADPVRVWRVTATVDEQADEHADDATSAVAQSSAASPDRALAQASPPIGGFLGALPDGPIVAREPELEHIVAALDATIGGAGRVLMLGGEPGVGKTRLAQEAMLAARNRAFFVATGRAYEPQQAVAYYPFLEAMSRAYNIAPVSLRADIPQHWPDVARLLPDQPIGVQASASSGSPEERQRLFWHVTGFLQALAAAQPVALLLDDLQWADSASLDLLQHLARHTHASRILLLGTYRDLEVTAAHPVDAMLRDLGREHLVERLAVRRLSLDGTTELLTATLGRGHLSDELAAVLYPRTDGNPFFTVEVMRELVERGAIYQESDRWQLRAQMEIVLPETVRSVIGQRLARLSEATLGILQETSILGQVFRFSDLRAMSAQSAEAIEAALEEAESAVLVREIGHDRYAFHHVLIQQTLYSALTTRRRRRLHRAAGEALEKLPERERERRVAELAYHFSRTDQWEKALGYLRIAAEQAGAVGGRREEAALLGSAITCAEALEQEELVTELRAKRGRALLAVATVTAWTEAAGELNAALTSLANGMEEVGAELRTQRIEQRIRVLCTLEQVYYQLLDAENQRLCAVEALALAEALAQSGDAPQHIADDLMTHAVAANAEVALNTGDLEKTVATFERAFVLGSERHRAALVPGARMYGAALYWHGQCGTADVQRARVVAEITQEAHDPNSVGLAMENLALVLMGGGHYDEALRTFEEARRYNHEQGTGPWYARAICMTGGLRLEVFDFAGAQALAYEAREVAHSVNWPPTTASAGIDLLFNFARSKNTSQAETLLPEVEQAIASTGGLHGWLWPMRYAQAQAEIAIERGQWERAINFAMNATARARRHGRVKYEVLGLQAHAQALAALGHTKQAILVQRDALTLARPSGDPVLFLRAAAALLIIEGDDSLLAEARAAVERITAAAPGELRRIFVESETVRLVARMSQ